MTEGQRGTRTSVKNIVLGSCLLLVSVAALALALFPIYVIRPFREQKPAALQHALWVTLHDKPILFGLFLLIAICALFVWRRAGRVPNTERAGRSVKRARRKGRGYVTVLREWVGQLRA